jgi:hypothetical protein
MECLVLRKSAYAGAGEPSFFYLMMAGSCFRRSASARHPQAGGLLRRIGREYLMKAAKVTSALGPTRRDRGGAPIKSWPRAGR